jgi:hypothetical protein
MEVHFHQGIFYQGRSKACPDEFATFGANESGKFEFHLKKLRRKAYILAKYS